MLDILKCLYQIFEFIFAVFLMWLMLYSFWHGAKLETGNLVIELYGVSRFFN